MCSACVWEPVMECLQCTQQEDWGQEGTLSGSPAISILTYSPSCGHALILLPVYLVVLVSCVSVPVAGIAGMSHLVGCV